RAQQMESVGTLAGGIAHDFNNLLTAILGNLHLVALEVAPGSVAADCLAEATKAGERGAELVRQLLGYARPGIEDVERVSLRRLLEETTALVGRGLTPSIQLSVEPPPESAHVTGSFA